MKEYAKSTRKLNKNKIYFIDRFHLSKESARLISVDLIKLIDNIYKTKN